MRATRTLDPHTKGDRKILYEAWKWDEELPRRFKRTVRRTTLRECFREARHPNTASVALWVNFRLAAIATWGDKGEKVFEVGIAAKRNCPPRDLARLLYSSGFLLFRDFAAQELYCDVHRANRPARKLAKSCGFREELQGDRVRLFMNRETYEDYHAHAGGILDNYEQAKDSNSNHQ